MQSNWEKKAAMKAGGVVSLKTAWENAARACLNAGLDEETIIRLISRWAHPSSLIKLCDSFSKGDSPIEASAFLRNVAELSRESDFDIDGWIEALEPILQCLVREGRSSSLKTMLGYLSCASEISGSLPGRMDFKQVVEDSLREFGFEG